ncbi:acyl-CoA dehydrogenase [Kiloniella laminariae]|uniref:Acyl-CoA dehydrogenase n=1 Tax=Kiloniella laminariae TaxID=454162 RepID=A0ABT4LPC1_9PROT|nr:acyl-CoA dehydrogenase [Kiloniella laminariae]MCZ4282973.1 acyl-CoA dehydrogenase [Kiloniella laminariae]
MSVLLSEEHNLIRETARDFSREQLAPFAAEWDKKSLFPKDAIKAMGELGFMGMLVPPELGGAGTDHVSYVLALIEIAAGDGSCSTVMSVQNSLVCSPIQNYGNEDQKKRYLGPLARGEMLGCFGLTEPGAGSDAAALTTKARREGSDYVLSGSKQFISTGSNADLAVVFAVTDPAAGKKRITAFLVPTDTPGFTCAKIEEKLGQHASDTAHLVFEDCRIPLENRLGEEGEGYKIALSNLEGGRLGIASQSIGMARSAYQAARRYAKERKTFGKAIAEHQAVAFRLADMATRLQAAELMVLEAARLRDAGLPCLKEASMAKLFASEMAEQVCSDAIQVHGGYGYLRDYEVERIYRDVRVCQIYEGTSDIQRLIISRQILQEDEA